MPEFWGLRADDEILDFLDAQLSHEEQVARSAQRLDSTCMTEHAPPLWQVYHETFSPDYMLSEVQARREMINHLADVAVLSRSGLRQSWAFPLVRSLVLPYRDRPGFQERWLY